MMISTDEKPGSVTAPPLFDLGRFESAGLRMTQRRYESGQTIFMEGDPADRLYLLTEGMVKICKVYSDHRQATVALLKDGGGFGDFDLFSEYRQNSTAQSMTDCQVVSMRKGDLRLAIAHRPTLAVELFAVFSEELRRSERTLSILFHREVSARLASLIPMLARKFGEYSEEADGFIIPLTHGELAEMIASTREAVTKALGEFRDEGLIELGWRRIVIPDRAALDKYVERDSATPAFGAADSRRATE